MQRLHTLTVRIYWFEEHLNVHNYRKRTIEDYRSELFLFHRWLLNETTLDDIDDITGQDLHNYVAMLYTRNLCAGTIGHKIAVLNSFFHTLYEEKKLYRNLSSCLSAPRIEKKLPPRILKRSQMETVFAILEHDAAHADATTYKGATIIRDYAMLELLYSTGIRRNEIIALTVDDMDYSCGLLHVREGKGGNARVVPLGDKALLAIQTYLRSARSRLLCNTVCEYLFVTRHGKMSTGTPKYMLKNIARKAGIKRPIRPHDLRHTCATHMLDCGADIRYVQELLGHKKLSTTQIYTHVSIEKLKQVHARCHPRER